MASFKPHKTHYGPAECYNLQLISIRKPMTAPFKESNISLAVNKRSSDIKSFKPRPNIDHLIKKIIVEREKENKKNLIIIGFIFLIIIGSLLSFI